MSDTRIFALVSLLRAIVRDNSFDEMPESLQQDIENAIADNV